MGPFAAFAVMFVVISIISSITRAGKNAAASSRGQTGDQTPVRAVPAMTEQQTAHQKEYERLKKLREERANQILNSIAGRGVSLAEKPVVEHSTDDCTGGSIHDGYHEGTVRRPAAPVNKEGAQGLQGERRGTYAKGATGLGMQAGEGVGTAKASFQGALAAQDVKAESGADKLVKAISSKPAIVQGIIWSEVLGKPLSE